MIRLYSLLLFIPSIVLSQIASLSIEDIWVDYDFYPRNLGDLHWVGDSDFAKLENQQTFKPNIATYSIKSGRKTGLLLESKKYENFIKNIFKSKNTSLPEGARNLNNFLISDFQISPDNDIILLEVGLSLIHI